MSLNVSILLFVVTGLIYVASGVPLWRRRVRPNAWYGIRVRATFADERVWYDANEASGRDLVLVGLVIGLLSLAVPIGSDLEALEHTLLLVVVTVLGTGWFAWTGIARANRLLGELDSPTSSSGDER